MQFVPMPPGVPIPSGVVARRASPALRVLLACGLALAASACSVADTVSGGRAGETSGVNQFATPTSQAASIGSAKIEALLGAGFGASLGPGDVEAAYEAQLQALEVSRPGTAVTWSNPRTGNRGEIVPGPTYIVNALECRDFSHAVETKAGRDVRSGTACRRAEGGWQSIA